MIKMGYKYNNTLAGGTAACIVKAFDTVWSLLVGLTIFTQDSGDAHAWLMEFKFFFDYILYGTCRARV